MAAVGGVPVPRAGRRRGAGECKRRFTDHGGQLGERGTRDGGGCAGLAQLNRQRPRAHSRHANLQGVQLLRPLTLISL